MERLTNAPHGNLVLPVIPMKVTTVEEVKEFLKQRGYYHECLVKLSRYEDTGLEPEDVAKIQEENARLRRICASFEVSGGVWE